MHAFGTLNLNRQEEAQHREHSSLLQEEKEKKRLLPKTLHTLKTFDIPIKNSI